MLNQQTPFNSKSNPINRRKFLQAAAASSAFIGLPWLQGCNPKMPLRVAGHPWPGYEMLYLARDLGWSLPNVDFIDTKNASESMEALRNSETDAAMLTLDEVVRLCAEGMDLTIPLVFNISLGADVVLTRPGYKVPQDLIGKTLGYEDSALGALMLHEFVNKFGLQKSDFNLKTLTFDQHAAAWNEQQVDVLITFEPNSTKFLKNNNAQKIFDTRQIPDRVFDVLAIKTENINSFSTELNTLVSAHFKALHYYRTNSTDAIYRLTSRLDQIGAEDILQIYRGLHLPDQVSNQAYLSEADQRITNATNQLIQIMRNANILQPICEPTINFTDRFIPRVS